MLSYAVVLAGVAVLVMLYRRDRSLLKAQRAKFFDLCLDLFQAYRVTQDGPDYPLLSGRYRDHEVRLQPLVDNMAWRKVPVLWLKVTVLKPNSYQAILDFLVRPGGVEVYSPSDELHYHLPLPGGWPEQALLCTDDPSSTPPLELITPHMGVFADVYMKELVVTLARRAPDAHDLAGQAAALRRVAGGQVRRDLPRPDHRQDFARFRRRDRRRSVQCRLGRAGGMTCRRKT